ncbi:hypothetical protein PIB30_007595 [Stylosanthes scabra]|uniref:Uncharacterized protein n=1 Tax=Stylosanthes scabra TaxID=79078 RepID=A0ABU6U3J2_9FABA|nr:hypothetical protein [Stylosanthes scabra]
MVFFLGQFCSLTFCICSDLAEPRAFDAPSVASFNPLHRSNVLAPALKLKVLAPYVVKCLARSTEEKQWSDAETVVSDSDEAASKDDENGQLPSKPLLLRKLIVLCLRELRLPTPATLFCLEFDNRFTKLWKLELRSPWYQFHGWKDNVERKSLRGVDPQKRGKMQSNLFLAGPLVLKLVEA